jgi:hypothetical protein
MDDDGRRVCHGSLAVLGGRFNCLGSVPDSPPSEHYRQEGARGTLIARLVSGANRQVTKSPRRTGVGQGRGEVTPQRRRRVGDKGTGATCLAPGGVTLL